ncbi:MAG TPA: hypothetical protein VNL14_16195 [Candidatus Acidoferrales bacterium]|nr:hypothetical protein [Candidatus Acidoferrales bacterium]
MNKRALIITFAAGVLAAAPLWGAERERAADRGGRYSDRERMSDWDRGKKDLEQALKLGESKPWYRQQIAKHGFQITAVNHDRPDYVEYEIVKGDNSYEVQIDLDKSGKASKVEIDRNLWRAAATERALEGKGKQPVGRADEPPRGDPRYSDRDRRQSSARAEQELQQALKTGEEKGFYRRELEKMGWKIAAVNQDRPDYAEYEIVKGDRTYEVQIDFDKNSRKASKVDVVPNMWRAEQTKRAMEGSGRAGSERRSGDSR